MGQPNKEFDTLLQAIRAYCDWQRTRATQSMTAGYDIPSRIVNITQKQLPNLAKNFDHRKPVTIHAREIIEFGVAGLNDASFFTIWREYFLGGCVVSDVATLTHYSPKTIQRRIQQFPETVATQLWQKNYEENPSAKKVSPKTLKQRQLEILRQNYNLSAKEAELLWMFVQPGRVGRQAIAEKLLVSENTLKTHIRSIIRKMDKPNMNEAAKMARALLRNYLDHESS